MHSAIGHPRIAQSIALLVPLLLAATVATGATYSVGPGKEYARISAVTSMLRPGDVVDVYGDVEDSFILSQHGTKEKPITIRGITRAEQGGVVRPRVTFLPEKGLGIVVRGDWNVIEGLDLSGATNGRTFMKGTAVYSRSDHLVVRNCRIHHNRQGVYGDEE